MQILWKIQDFYRMNYDAPVEPNLMCDKPMEKLKPTFNIIKSL